MRQICQTCGRDHQRLNVEFRERTLVRHVRAEHRVHRGGEGFAFDSRFFDAHRQEIAEVVIVDQSDGSIYTADRDAIERAERVVLSQAFGEQLVFRLAKLQRTRSRPVRHVPAPEPITAAPTSAEDPSAQLSLL